MIGWLHGSGISGWWEYSFYLADLSLEIPAILNRHHSRIICKHTAINSSTGCASSFRII